MDTILEEYIKYRDFMDYAGEIPKHSFIEECALPYYVKLAWLHEVCG